MGKVYKEEYFINAPSNILHGYHVLSLKDNDTELILEQLIRCNVIVNRKSMNKNIISLQELIKINKLIVYEEFDTIETDIELRDEETIKIQDKDYKVLYKFNKDLNRHELYLDDYEIRIEIDDKLKKQCEDKVSELNKQIEEYNKMINKPAVISEDVGILNKIKSWFNRKCE
jgi:hypothetical protein